MLLRTKRYAPLILLGISLLLVIGCGRRSTLRKAKRAAEAAAKTVPTQPAIIPASTNSTATIPPAIPTATHQQPATPLHSLPLHEEAKKHAPPPPALPVLQAAIPEIKKTAEITTKLKKRASSIYDANNPDELDFEVENKTGKTVYVACFSYQPRRQLERWHWIKSPVYEIAPYKTVTIDVDTIEEKLDRSFVFGYLGIFPTKEEAGEAVFELLPDKQKLDLDLLTDLKGKKVTLMIERYGMKGDLLEYDFVKKGDVSAQKNERDDLVFSVENATGKTVFIACFVYQKKAKGSWIGATEEKDDMSLWRYQKMNVVRLEPNQSSNINVGDIATLRDKSYVRGDLAIFDESQEHLAYRSTYELLPHDCKLDLGLLSRLANKKIVLEVENYGIVQDYFNYIVKQPKHIDFQAIHQKEKK